MGIFKWTPTFTSAQESSIVLVGVCFLELLAHLFHKDALFTVASMIRASLQIDDFTFNQSKLSKARVGIEIDLMKPLVEEFGLLINGITILQKIARVDENYVRNDEKEFTLSDVVCGVEEENGLHAGNYISTANSDKEASYDIVNEINCAETGDPDACCESGAGVNTVGEIETQHLVEFFVATKAGIMRSKSRRGKKSKRIKVKKAFRLLQILSQFGVDIENLNDGNDDSEDEANSRQLVAPTTPYPECVKNCDPICQLNLNSLDTEAGEQFLQDVSSPI
ncbi:UNVERIFIED_CONTAM: hypothetical protein Sradi_5064900 [Sesamum radiatum]|uniref:Uncharacterized protein n=1 Tax=Sesamum radiatum TaxID=300843 RepID=A0AAW2M4M7_SESRA